MKKANSFFTFQEWCWYDQSSWGKQRVFDIVAFFVGIEKALDWLFYSKENEECE